MRVLVTGVTGFLGGHLARRLLAGGAEVVGTGLAGETACPGCRLHEVDVRDREGLARLVDAVSPDRIVHLAALSHVGQSWQRPDDYFAVNVLGVEHLLAAAGPRRTLFVSSAEVYGLVPEPEQPIPDDRAVAPRSPYALTKAAAERLAVAAGALVVRCFNLVGAGQARTFALPGFAAQLAEIASGRAAPTVRIGNLAARRDFVHVEDAVDAFLLLLERGRPGGIYNVATGAAWSIADLLARLIARAGVEVETVVDAERMRPVDIPLLSGRADRLAALGWQPRRGLDDALADLWREARERMERPACDSC